MPIRLAIHGAAGRMGQRLIALSQGDPALTVAAAIDAPGNPDVGRDAGTVAGVGAIGVPIRDTLEGAVDVVIDFSVPEAASRLVQFCTERQIALVLATTGFDAEQKARIASSAHLIPILWSPSMSLAVNLAMKLTGMAATAVKNHASGVDVEIIERHHRFKEDSPSGTALKFGDIVAKGMGITEHKHGRQGQVGKRPRNEIGYHAVRTGDNPGEHTIVFGFLGETLELTVKATNRDCYARGALAAAQFLYGKPAGMYGMEDVLGLR
jgi:4-hydroxy-tetrahydrodipicolinate reductase